MKKVPDNRAWWLVLPVLLMLYPFYHFFPIERSSVKDAIDYVQQHMAEDDLVFFTHETEVTFNYYRATGYISEEMLERVAIGHGTIAEEIAGNPVFAQQRPCWIIFTSLWQTSNIPGKQELAPLLREKKFVFSREARFRKSAACYVVPEATGIDNYTTAADEIPLK